MIIIRRPYGYRKVATGCRAVPLKCWMWKQEITMSETVILPWFNVSFQPATSVATTPVLSRLSAIVTEIDQRNL